MSFFNTDSPIFLFKKSAFDAPAIPGVWRIHWQMQNRILFSSFYTPHDQTCLIWAVISALVFASAQFLALDWTIQTLIAAALTLFGLIGMIRLTWQLVMLEQLSGVLGTWVGLMLMGAIATYQAIWGHWGWALMHICPIWLIVSGLGYAITGIGLRSRLFLLLSLLHGLGLPILFAFPAWKPLITGLIISGSAFLVAELQWDANGVCGYQLASEQSSNSEGECSLADELWL